MTSRRRTDPSSPPPRPTRAQLDAARGARVPDLIRPGLSVLFCGINPSLYSAVVGHHFARPGNRFWPALHGGGFTPRLFAPSEGPALLALGYGITNVVDHATATADELPPEDLLRGGRSLVVKLRRYRPRYLAVLGVTAFRTAFQRPRAVLGPQREPLADARVWVLPNPSGLNAHYQAADLARLFGELRAAFDAP